MKVSVLVGLVGVAFGALWLYLPALVQIARQRPVGNSMGLKRLQISHAMAGGGEVGDRNIADAMRSLARATVVGARADARARGVPVAARDAWREFTDSLRAAESQYLHPRMGFGLGPPAHAQQEVAEGLRYVAHVTRLALDVYLESAPRFVPMVSPTLKLLGDNPDALYFISALNNVGNGSAYEVSGCRSGEVYLSLSIHAHAEPGKAFQKVVADLNDGSIRFDGNGCYRVVLSPTAPPGHVPGTGANWLQLPDNAASVVTRHYFEPAPAPEPVPSKVSGTAAAAEVGRTLRTLLPAQLHEQMRRNVALRIRWTGTSSNISSSAALTDQEMSKRVQRATDFVRAHTIDMPQPDPSTAPPFFALVPNRIGPPQRWSQVDMEGMGAVDIAYAAGRFMLAKDEALIIAGTMPSTDKCRFANVVLWNRFLQSFDYSAATEGASGAVSLARPQMHLRDDGKFLLVLAEKDPLGGPEGAMELHANWMTTEGRATGTIFFRFVLPEVDVPQPRTQVVRAGDDIRAALRTFARF